MIPIVVAVVWTYSIGCMVTWVFNDEKNVIRATAKIVCWPVVAAPGVLQLLRCAVRRIVVDAKALLPKRDEQTPPRVTVEMLAAESKSRYQPGQWIG